MRYEAVAVRGVARARLEAGLSAVERVRSLVVQLRASLWLLPAASAWSGSCWPTCCSSCPTPARRKSRRRWSIFSGDAETARQLLATLAGGMISMTSLVVSITVVVLTLAANPLGPRLFADFVGDRQVKTVLGLFIGTIVYLLTVLRGLDHALPAAQMPYLAVTVETALTILCWRGRCRQRSIGISTAVCACWPRSATMPRCSTPPSTRSDRPARPTRPF